MNCDFETLTAFQKHEAKHIHQFLNLFFFFITLVKGALLDSFFLFTSAWYHSSLQSNYSLLLDCKLLECRAKFISSTMLIKMIWRLEIFIICILKERAILGNKILEMT